MKVHHLLKPTSFGPEALDRMTKAFNEAWDQIESRIGSDAAEVESARRVLAKAIIEAARGGVDDVEAVEVNALEIVFGHFHWK